jgi:hypothetical protein
MGDHDREQLAALGRIMVDFSALESLALLVVAGLTGMETRAAEIVLSPTSFKQRLDLIRSLTKHKYQQVPQQLSDALDEAEKASKSRNKIVHSAWMEKRAEIGSRPGYIIYTPKVRQQPEEMPLDRLVATAEKIRIAAEKLINAYVALLKSKGEIVGVPGASAKPPASPT